MEIVAHILDPDDAPHGAVNGALPGIALDQAGQRNDAVAYRDLNRVSGSILFHRQLRPDVLVNLGVALLEPLLGVNPLACQPGILSVGGVESPPKENGATSSRGNEGPLVGTPHLLEHRGIPARYAQASMRPDGNC